MGTPRAGSSSTGSPCSSRRPGAPAKHKAPSGRELFVQLGEAGARRLGVPFRWSMKTAPGVGHSNEKMAEAAAAALFAGKDKEKAR